MRPRALAWTLPLLLLVLGCASRAPAPAAAPRAAALKPDQVLPVDPQVVDGRLDNGLRYVIRQHGKPEKRAELRLTVDAGSVLEEDQQQGLAHFVEHMAFNGTTHFARQELVNYLESIGMEFGPEVNAYTGFDETVYMLTVPTDSTEVMEKAFQILEDWADGISFDDHEIDQERGVIKEEWRLGRGAQQRMFDKQVPILFEGSRYAQRLPIGQPAVIDTFHHDAVRRFYHTWYRPELIGLVAVGDFDPQQVEALVRQHMGRVPVVSPAPERVVYEVPDHDETLFAIATDPEATSNEVAIVYKRPVRDQRTVDAYRRNLIGNLYHGMLNQRLYELTKVADPPFLGASSDQGRWVRSREAFMLAATVQDNGFGRGVEALLTEAARVQQHGFTDSELGRQKKEMLRSMEQAYRERDKTWSSTFASEYVRHLLEDEPIPGIEMEYQLYQELLPGITLQEVNSLASEWTSPKSRVVLVDAPDKPGTQVPTQNDLTGIFQRVAGTRIEPYQDTVSDTPILPHEPRRGRIEKRDEIAEIGVTMWTLSNGVRVLLKPTDFQNDQVAFSSFSPGGHSLVPDSEYVAAWTADDVARQGGVASFSLVELQKKLAGKVVSVSPWIADLQEGISGSASPQDLPTAFELIHAYFVAPRADSTAFRALVTQYRGFVENRSARPETAFGDTLQVTMAQHHFRARPLSLSLLDEMSLNSSMAVYRDRFADAGDFTFAFVGNFTLEQIEPLVTTYLASLPTTGRKETWRDVGIDPPQGRVEKVVRRGVDPKSRTQIVFTGPFQYDGWRNSFELGALAQVLEIKLREVLREDLGGTYGVGVGAQGSHYPDQEYQVSIGFGCDPARVDELTHAVFQQIDSLKTVGIAESYVAKMKEIDKRNREVELKENDFWLDALTSAAWNGLDPRRVVHYPEMVDSLTVGDVQEAARQYLNEQNYVQVTLLPAAAP